MTLALTPLARGAAPTRRPAARATVAAAEAGPAGGQAIRIKLKSFDKALITESAAAIVDAAKATGAAVSGPVPLPTRCVLRVWAPFFLSFFGCGREDTSACSRWDPVRAEQRRTRPLPGAATKKKRGFGPRVFFFFAGQCLLFPRRRRPPGSPPRAGARPPTQWTGRPAARAMEAKDGAAGNLGCAQGVPRPARP